MRQVLAMVLAGGQGERLSILSEERAKPAVPFGGKYRIIDFVLSNCVNSGLYDVAVLTQYRPRSLEEHIGSGKPWDLNRARGGILLLQPYLGNAALDWYRGTADAVYHNLYLVDERHADHVLILGGDHIYKMDYRPFLEFHDAMRADVTVAVMEIPIEEAHRFGILALDEYGRVVDLQEKPEQPTSNLVSMGIYVFNRDKLVQRLEEDARDPESTHDFGRTVIPRMVPIDRVYAYRHRGYWMDVGTVQAYWDANMDLLKEPPSLGLYDTSWRIHTRSEERAPARIHESATIANSLICHGCIIEGTVERSVLCPGVRIGPGATVRDSIVMTDTVIGPGAVVDRSILDKEVTVGAGATVGYGADLTPNHREPTRLNTGITVVGKRAHVPANARIGRNVKIAPAVCDKDYPSLEIPSGDTVEHRAALATGL